MSRQIISPGSQSSALSSITNASSQSITTQDSEVIYVNNGEEIRLRQYSAESAKWTQRKKFKIVDEMVQMVNDNVQLKKCCSNNCISAFTMEQIQKKRYEIHKENQERKRFLINLAKNEKTTNPEKKLVLCSKEVCVTAFCYITGISRHSIYNAQSTKKRYKTSKKHREDESNDYELEMNEMKLDYYENRKSTHIIKYLQHLKEFNEFMPDSDFVHIPHASKYDVFINYLYDNPNYKCSLSYFKEIWNTKFPEIKVRKYSKFTHCSFCDERKDILATSLDTNVRNVAKKEYREHLKFIKAEKSLKLLQLLKLIFK